MKRVFLMVVRNCGADARRRAELESAAGHNCPDAPSQFELGRQLIANSGYGKPTQAAPEPAADPRASR